MEINALALTCALFIHQIDQQGACHVKESVLDRAGRYRRLRACSDQRSRRNSFGA
jgi:hypothetical protein